MNENEQKKNGQSKPQSATPKQVNCIRALQFKLCGVSPSAEELGKMDFTQASGVIDRLKVALNDTQSETIDRAALGLVFKLTTQELNIGWILLEPTDFLDRVRKMYFLYKDAEKHIRNETIDPSTSHF
jgi:hypothetical protein